MEFKERLKKLRTDKGLSQKELAQEAGIHIMNISKYERGENKPSSTILSKIANVLNVTTDYLMVGAIGEQATSSISDKELLDQFHRLEKLSPEKKHIIKEVIDAYLFKTTVQNLAS
jgi:transcriptional regulator with XRE-family HTH domain